MRKKALLIIVLISLFASALFGWNPFREVGKQITLGISDGISGLVDDVIYEKLPFLVKLAVNEVYEKAMSLENQLFIDLNTLSKNVFRELNSTIDFTISQIETAAEKEIRTMSSQLETSAKVILRETIGDVNILVQNWLAEIKKTLEHTLLGLPADDPFDSAAIAALGLEQMPTDDYDIFRFFEMTQLMQAGPGVDWKIRTAKLQGIGIRAFQLYNYMQLHTQFNEELYQKYIDYTRYAILEQNFYSLLESHK